MDFSRSASRFLGHGRSAAIIPLGKGSAESQSDLKSLSWFQEWWLGCGEHLIPASEAVSMGTAQAHLPQKGREAAELGGALPGTNKLKKPRKSIKKREKERPEAFSA